jgi:hypothetical protein
MVIQFRSLMIVRREYFSGHPFSAGIRIDNGDASINCQFSTWKSPSNRIRRATVASEKVASPINEGSLRPGARCSPRVVLFVVAKERCQQTGALSDVLPAFGLPKALVLPVSSCVGCIGFTGKRS